MPWPCCPYSGQTYSEQQQKKMAESDPDNPSEVLLEDTETVHVAEDDPGQLQEGGLKGVRTSRECWSHTFGWIVAREPLKGGS